MGADGGAETGPDGGVEAGPGGGVEMGPGRGTASTRADAGGGAVPARIRSRMSCSAVGRNRWSLASDAHSSGASSPGKPDKSGSRFNIRCITTGSGPSPNAARPVAANTIVPAHANTSLAGSASPRNCSGAMNAGVPTMLVVRLWLASRARAIPKSITRGPSGPSSTLLGLKSRCTTPAPWMATSAVAVVIASRSSAGPRTGPSLVTWCWSDGPSTYSPTMYGWSLTAPTSSTRAVQNSATRRADSASRRKRRTACSSSANLACSSLMATCSPPGETPR
jgi:hypothetical protein